MVLFAIKRAKIMFFMVFTYNYTINNHRTYVFCSRLLYFASA